MLIWSQQKNQLPTICCLFLMLTCNISALEVAKPVFDQREWQLAWSKKAGTDQETFNEYILKGDNIQNWSELVTIQFFPGLQNKISLNVFANSTKDSITHICPSTEWNVLQKTKTEIIWQFTVTNCHGQQDQTEIARAIRTNQGIHVFHYAIKQAPMPKDKEKVWLKNIKAVEISQS